MTQIVHLQQPEKSKLISRAEARQLLGLDTDAKLKNLIQLGKLHPHKLTGSFARSEVEQLAITIEKEILENGNMEQGEKLLASLGGDWGQPQVFQGKESWRNRKAG
jgi:hypothetical protein